MKQHRKKYKRSIDQDIKDKSIHHLDLNHSNNKIENLVALDPEIHSRLHQLLHYVEVLDILEKYERDKIKVYRDDGFGTTFPRSTIKIDNQFLKQNKYEDILNKLCAGIDEISDKLFEAIDYRDKHFKQDASVSTTSSTGIEDSLDSNSGMIYTL